MQDEMRKEKQPQVLNQSFTIALSNELDMANNELAQTSASQHAHKGHEYIRYHAGCLTTSQKGSDDTIIKKLNEDSEAPYCINTLGKTMHNGNQYTYIGFYTKQARDAFCDTSGKMENLMGKCRPLEWLDAVDHKVTLSLTNIKKGSNEENILARIEQLLGQIIQVTSRIESHGKVT